MPPDDQLPERLAGVLHVIHLVSTEGHVATTGDALLRADLCEEAIRLARLLADLVPADAETHGLLALLLLTDARRLAPSPVVTINKAAALAAQRRALEARAARLS